MRASLSVVSVMVLVVALGASRPAFAQGPSGEPPPRPRAPESVLGWEVLVSGGSAFTIAKSPSDSRFAILSFNLGHLVTRRRGPGPLAGRLEWLVEFVPLFLLSQSERTYGYGASPLYFRWHFAEPRVRPFIEISGGFLRTDRPVPEGHTRFNYTAQTGLGFRVPVTSGHDLLLGYRFHHVSNAGRVSPNFSLNSHVVYSGLSFGR